MKRYLGTIVPVCTMIMVVGSINIMLISDKNLAKAGDNLIYRSALVSSKMIDAPLAKTNNTVVRFVTEPEKVVKSEKITKTDVKVKDLPKDMPKAKVDTLQLNVREGSHKDEPVITRILEGQEVGLTGNKNEDNGWVEVVVHDQDGTIGWVNGEFLREE